TLRTDAGIAVLLFVVVLLVYNATLTPSLSYASADGNELATVPYVLGLAHATGYPLYTWLGKLFTFLPVGDVAHRMNLMSAVMGAGAVALLYIVLRLLLRDRSFAGRAVAIFTTLLFAFSLTFWSQAVITEVYAPNALMVGLTLLFLLLWARTPHSLHYLFLFAFSYALSFGTHLSNLGFLPGFLLFILLVDWRVLLNPKALAVGIGGFLIGLLQFLWLPYKANTLNDAFMRRDAPNTLAGFYRYTLGAFPQFKFAFPIWALPDRLVLYLELLRQQYGIVGILTGLLGMWTMCFRRPKHFFLLVTLYVVHVVFFIQYRAFDLDVFFIPAHLIYAIFIGFGIWQSVDWVRGRLQQRRWAKHQAVRAGMNLLLLLSLLFLLSQEVQANWDRNDRSSDTAINDFYQNVWTLLPEGSALLGPGGVFGFDMFYYRLVYNVRPDVLIPHLTNPRPHRGDLAERELYSVIRLDRPGGNRGPGALPPGLLPPDVWYVPVLLGNGGQQPTGRSRELVLYHITRTPPVLMRSPENAAPQVRSNLVLGPLTLIGYDLGQTQAAAGGNVLLRFYWQVNDLTMLYKTPPRLSTALDGIPLETHSLGLGNLERYIRELHPSPGDTIVESYRVVIPRLTVPGPHTLQVGLVIHPTAAPEWHDLIRLSVRSAKLK
ncbi:MAG TPA: DUF2723 domain-containing protein, partial [Anaerolineae bacterium]|nr:DUF2723 domain-containing protein [Anaerolineae bacterium]